LTDLIRSIQSILNRGDVFPVVVKGPVTPGSGEVSTWIIKSTLPGFKNGASPLDKNTMNTSTNRKSKSLRHNLLAKIHIAKKDLCLIEDDYRDILIEKFGVSSAGALSNREMGELVDYFQSKGWKSEWSINMVKQVKSLIGWCAFLFMVFFFLFCTWDYVTNKMDSHERRIAALEKEVRPLIVVDKYSTVMFEGYEVYGSNNKLNEEGAENFMR
jgi:hypothetical protein